MDKRGTLSANESFTEILKSCYSNREKVAMLVDEEGISRVNGTIKNLSLDAQTPYVELHDGTQIKLHSIVAVNGTFSSDYSEC